jgi:hypothetical protein
MFRERGCNGIMSKGEDVWTNVCGNIHVEEKCTSVLSCNLVEGW